MSCGGVYFFPLLLLPYGFVISFLYIVLASLVLIIQTRLASTSQRSTCLCLPSAGNQGVSHHSWQDWFPMACLRVVFRILSIYAVKYGTTSFPLCNVWRVIGIPQVLIWHCLSLKAIDSYMSQALMVLKTHLFMIQAFTQLRVLTLSRFSQGIYLFQVAKALLSFQADSFPFPVFWKRPSTGLIYLTCNCLLNAIH